MVRDCKGCGKPYEGSPKSLFCADPECRRVRARARKRAERGIVIPLPAPVAEDGTVRSATFDALTSANRLDTPAGRLAMVLAERLSSGSSDTGSSLAALAKQHLAVLAEALKDAPKAADRVDDLRARREARLGRHA